MKSSCFFTIVFLSAAIAGSQAQTPAPAQPATNAAPASRRGQGARPVLSPEVRPDRQVTFRLRAPKAIEVVLAGQWANGRSAMAKDSNGVWSVTAGPIDPGVYEYSFQVDGLSMIDPGNPAIKPMRQPSTSILHLPGQPPLLHDYQDVAHGVIHEHTYQSKSLGLRRELAVYTPPGYHQSSARFPTLYLQHGSGDNQATWTVHGKAHWILDNLIAQKRAQPMVVVMMDGHTTAANASAGAGGLQNNTGLFQRDLLEDVMPFVEANYRVKTEPIGRAIAGLSMGGGQSLTIGLNHLERFAWVAGFSSAVPSREAIESVLKDETANEKLKLLWIGCGKSDFLLKRNEDFIALLKEKHLRHEWHLTEGGHTWPVWRIYLAEFAPKLFQ
jgi:enterochelin esterase-like enzyme